MIETMTSLVDANAAIRASRAVAPKLPLVVMMTVDQTCNCLDGASEEHAAARLTSRGALLRLAPLLIGGCCGTTPGSHTRDEVSYRRKSDPAGPGPQSPRSGG